jgi:hypothetical protein
MIIKGKLDSVKVTIGERHKKIYYYPKWSLTDEKVTTVGEIIDKRVANAAERGMRIGGY